MKKRVLVCLMVAVIALSVVFTACNKDVYVDPSTDSEYILVTDENGKKVLSEDGELLVYVTDADGKKVKDDNGEYETAVQGFIGQIEANGIVEDYAYYFTLPSGWKTVNNRGEFQNTLKKYSLEIRINDKTFNDYYAQLKQFGDAIKSGELATADNELNAQGEWYEFDYDNADTKVYLLMLKANDKLTATMFFSESDNLYVVTLTAPIGSDFTEVKEEMIKVYEALEFKPYTYYEGLTDKQTEESTVTETLEVTK